MRLKKLVVLGFKSFADRTVLNFDMGITCIVGPNGCGKSNIADAFRWVLGEQSAKSMRGAKMPDVIFAGTTQRKPLNFAEVSLTLTDIQGSLPIEYEEVTITRRLHRSGESEYLLNNNLVRLKDLQTLFLGSGVGRNAFSIFEQGKLDQVINYSPQERRYIFEEASGILRFLQRKKEALKRLEQAELNLSRIRDIYLEVEKQIQNLESQAKKALIYKEQKADLENLEKASYVLRWQGIEKKQTDFLVKLSKTRNRLEDHQNEGKTLQIQHQEAKLLLQRHERELRNQSEHLLTLRGKQEIETRELQSFQQRLKECSQRERKLKQEWEDLILARQTRQKMLKEIDRKKEGIENEWSEAETNWTSQQERVKLHEKEVVHLRGELAIKQQAHLNCLQLNSQYESEYRQSEVRLENLKGHQNQLEIKIQQLNVDRELLVKNVQERKQSLKQVSDLVDNHRDRLEQFEEDIRKLTGEGEARQKEFDACHRKLMEIKARLNVLLKMREEFEGFSLGSKTLLKETQRTESPFYKKLRPLYEFFSSDEEVIDGVAVVLRSYAQTLVIEKEKDVEELIRFAEGAGIEDFSLLCLEWMDRFHSQAVLPKKSLKDASAINHVSKHFLETISISESHHIILKDMIEGECREGWSLQGVFVDHRGVLFKIKPSENLVFIRESEIKSLEEQLDHQQDQFQKIEESLRHLQQKRSHLQLERGELDKMLRRDEMKLVEVNFGLQRSLSDQEKNQTERSRFENELVVLKDNLEEQKKAFQALEFRSHQIKQELNRWQEEKDFLQMEVGRQESTLRIQEQDQREKGAFYRQMSESRQQLFHQYQLLEAKEQDDEKNVKRIEVELEDLKEVLVQFKDGEKISQENFSALEIKIQEAAFLYSEKEKKGIELIQQSELLEKQFSSHQEEGKKIEQEVGHLDIQLAHQRAISQAVIEELSERYHLSIEEALKLPLEANKSLEQTEKKIKSLRQSIQEFGDVNLTAIEDLEKQRERATFLNQQMDDMLGSKEDLLSMISQLDGETLQIFKETFELIRTNFQKNFQILFNGGEADLQFTDSKNILEAGIEITAKPPGKQMRSMSLLSGGEKCLTAVALLFAIFEVKPSPFCILDEIDAPLDDTNVERFVNVVKHFADRCQFLIITHNKGTMAIGDILFGVSMEEKGVSKLLSLEFAHKEIPEAAML